MCSRMKYALANAHLRLRKSVCIACEVVTDALYCYSHSRRLLTTCQCLDGDF